MATFEIENGVLKSITAEDDETNIVIPEGVTCLSNGWSLKFLFGSRNRSVRLPSTLKEIEKQYNRFPGLHALDFGMANLPFKYSLRGAYNVMSRTILSADPDNPRFKVINGSFVDVIDKILYGEVEPDATIPDFIEKIEEFALRSNVEVLETGSETKDIERGAFNSCFFLKKLIINGKLERLCGDLLATSVKPEIIIHVSSKLKTVSKKPFNFDLVKEIYFDSKKEEFLKNPFINGYLNNSTKLDAKIYFLDENNNYVLDGTMEKYGIKKEIREEQ